MMHANPIQNSKKAKTLLVACLLAELFLHTVDFYKDTPTVYTPFLLMFHITKTIEEYR